MKLKEHEIITAYNNGDSMNFIAKKFHTYPTTVKRILERNAVVLRHDKKRSGAVYVKHGEKLIEWAKAQGRLVTKAELAEQLGRKRLSPSYFIKYPELGQYVVTRERDDLSEYLQMLYRWLQDNGIQYKPNDKTALGVTVDALLLGEYFGVAIQIDERPKCVSKKNYNNFIQAKVRSSTKKGILILFLTKENFEDLDKIKPLLKELKKRKWYL